MGQTEVRRRPPNALLKVAYKHLPILEWIQEYTKEDLVADFIAGVTISLTMIPQSIAYAALANLSPQYGLNSAFMGCFVYVFFGTVKEVVIGPSSLSSLLTYQYTHDLNPHFVVLLTFLSGIVEFIMGVLRLGFLVELIAVPVVSGFTSATAIIIIVSQIKGLLGIRFKSLGFVDNVRQVVNHVADTQWPDATLGCACIFVLLLLRSLKDVRVSDSFPLNNVVKKLLWLTTIGRNALVLITCCVITYSFESNGAHVPYHTTKSVKSGLPPIDFPPISSQVGNTTYDFPEMVYSLGSGFIVIPIVSVLANVAIAKAYSSGTVDATQEMITLAMCNIAGSFVSSMPTCGAFTRSAVISASGVRTPLAGLYSAGITLLALQFLSPYFRLIPRAALSAVLIAAIVFLIDFRIIKPLWKTCKRDFFTLVFTLISSLVLGVELGLLIGAGVGISFLTYKWARPPIIVEKRKGSEGDYIYIQPKIGVYFPGVDHLVSLIQEVSFEQGSKQMPVVIDCSLLSGTDYSAAKSLAFLSTTFRKRGQALLFLDVPPRFIPIWKAAGCRSSLFKTSIEYEELLFNTGEKYFKVNIEPNEEKDYKGPDESTVQLLRDGLKKVSTDSNSFNSS